jgi:hypothetical protein
MCVVVHTAEENEPTLWVIPHPAAAHHAGLCGIEQVARQCV